MKKLCVSLKSTSPLQSKHRNEKSSIWMSLKWIPVSFLSDDREVLPVKEKNIAAGQTERDGRTTGAIEMLDCVLSGKATSQHVKCHITKTT